VWLGCFVVFVVYAALGGLDGPHNYKPPFSSKACLQREQRYYLDRNPDMIDLPDDLSSAVAATCAREKVDYEYSN
jgi:hypothetical protein